MVYEFSFKWGTQGEEAGRFHHPEGIALDFSGNIFVADSFNNRIQKFSKNTSPIITWGRPGHGNAEFQVPRGLAVDSSGNVFVADQNNNRIQKFKNDGTFIKEGADKVPSRESSNLQLALL